MFSIRCWVLKDQPDMLQAQRFSWQIMEALAFGASPVLILATSLFHFLSESLSTSLGS